MTIHGNNLIAGAASQGTGKSFAADSPLDGSTLPGKFFEASPANVDAALSAAAAAFPAFAAVSPEQRAVLLETIADNIVALGDALLERCHQECGLPLARLQGERGRTVGQLRMFAAVARENSWQDPRIDTAQPDRQPLPKPDLRRLLIPLGPIVVFGASNFPLAFSVAGGDTASALATGNPVVVKAHDSHPGTSEMVADAVTAAVKSCGLPAGVFSMLHGPGRVLGPLLARHPASKAIALTGSLTAGRALFDAAASRPDPIPVFAEMSSLNPLIVLPNALANRATAIGQAVCQSVTLGVGQFCTKPGLIFVTESAGMDAFTAALAESFAAAAPATMLHAGICKSFGSGREHLITLPGLTMLAGSKQADPTRSEGAPAVMLTDVATFLATPALTEEYFGPLAIVVTGQSLSDISRCLAHLGGQLTITFHADGTDYADASGLIQAAVHMAGRIVFNSVPTGVEVCPSMQHGGPWPAASDARFTSVGTAALARFVRPVAFQGAPQDVLPAALQDANPLGLPRLVNGMVTNQPMA